MTAEDVAVQGLYALYVGMGTMLLGAAVFFGTLFYMAVTAK